jgi:hypothetical protein
MTDNLGLRVPRKVHLLAGAVARWLDEEPVRAVPPEKDAKAQISRLLFYIVQRGYRYWLARGYALGRAARIIALALSAWNAGSWSWYQLGIWSLAITALVLLPSPHLSPSPSPPLSPEESPAAPKSSR